jgi:GntR family transcriptional regulator
MNELGLNPSSTIVEFQIAAAEPQDAKLLKLPGHDGNVFRLVRVRRANDEPILLETTLIPHYLCPELLSANLERDSLYRVLRDQYNLTLHDAEETYEVAIVRANETKLLECRRNQPVFHIRRLANLADGTPFELTRSVGRGDSLQFSLHLVTNQAEFRRRVEVQREE